MYLVVSHPERRERRWYGPHLAGLVTVGSAREADIQIDGHNLAARHVVLRFAPASARLRNRVAIDVKSAFGVRVDGRLPRPDDQLGELTIGGWELYLHEHVPRGIEPVDEAFFAEIASDPDARAVYADSLEERGRLAEAELMRGRTDPLLAARTPPAWRRRFLPMVVESCPQKCQRSWSPDPCDRCQLEVPVVANLNAARERALTGRPLALDPSVRRWPNDLRDPVIRQPAIIMGKPR